jgi:hypothetical protein
MNGTPMPPAAKRRGRSLFRLLTCQAQRRFVHISGRPTRPLSTDPHPGPPGRERRIHDQRKSDVISMGAKNEAPVPADRAACAGAAGCAREIFDLMGGRRP